MNLDAFTNTESDLHKELKERFPLFSFEIEKTPNFTYQNRMRQIDPIKMYFTIYLVTSFGKIALKAQPGKQNSLSNASKAEVKVYQKLGFPDLWKTRKELEKILTKDKTQLDESKCIFIEYDGLTYVSERLGNGVYRTYEIV